MQLGARLMPLLVAALLAAGCGGSGRSGAGTHTGESASPSSSHGVAATPAVTILNFAYHPKTVTVKVGGKVTWTNRDSTNHTVTADSGAFDLGNLNTGQSKSMTFTKPGTYKYHCNYHPFMHGTVVVTR
jgi:plastocyanin